MNHLNARIRQNRSICVPFIDCTHYCDIVESPNGFRTSIDSIVEQWPELFPPDIVLGYLMKDIRLSKKLLIPVRRIEILGISYTIRPSFVMPYMTGFVDDVEKGLFLLKFDVPFWALPHVCGKNPMYWFRMEQSLGRNSIVGTTVKKPGLMKETLGKLGILTPELIYHKSAVNFYITELNSRIDTLIGLIMYND